MSKGRPHLRLVPPPSETTLLLERLSGQPYHAGTRDRARERRADMLRHRYPHPNIPPSEVEERMDRLKADVLEAIEATSRMTEHRFPFVRIRELHTSLWAIDAVENFMDGDPDKAERMRKNRLRRLRELVDALWQSAETSTHREGMEHWLATHDRTCPNDTDLIFLAVSEINADRIDAALPRVLVLPNRLDPFNPFYVRLADSIVTDAEIAGLLSSLFSG